MIPRLVEISVLSGLKSSNKIILVLGARQVGKTTLVKDIQAKLQQEKQNTLYLNCDLDEERNLIDTTSITPLKNLFSTKTDVLLIDEAQRLGNPGLTLKIIHDNFPKLKVLATGSSSFELKNKLSDPLTGRYIDFTLYPFSFMETLSIDQSQNLALEKAKADTLLPQILIYGLYPDVYREPNPKTKQILLEKIIESYLFKDVLSFQRIKNSQAIKDLARALAYQVGSEINENELASRLKIDRKTVVSYIDILEKTYVITRLYPFSRNPRREIGRNYKVYFMDIGIRNALIKDFNPIALRGDTGFLWENFLLLERLKGYSISNRYPLSYFWRSYSGAEVDYIEKSADSNNLKAYEWKYTAEKISRGAYSFSQQYKTAVQIINNKNYLNFISL